MKIPLNKLTQENASGASMMDTPFYILELRDQIKALREEVEVLKPNKPVCEKCGRYQVKYTTYSLATGKTKIGWDCLNNECVPK